MTYPLIYAQWLKALENGKFLGVRCGFCQAVNFPPKAVCADCGSRDLAVMEIDPRGVIRTFTVIRIPPLGFTAPYVVVLAELDQGPWVVGNLLGVEADLASSELIGKRVALGSRAVPAGMFAGGDTRALTFEMSQGL